MTPRWWASVPVVLAGVHVKYNGTLDDRARALISSGLRALAGGRLRRWRMERRGGGSCMVDLPAELDVEGAFAALAADPAYGPLKRGRGKKGDIVEPTDIPSGHNGWIRVLGLGGCIDIEDQALQPDLFPELIARDKLAA